MYFCRFSTGDYQGQHIFSVELLCGIRRYDVGDHRTARPENFLKMFSHLYRRLEYNNMYISYIDISPSGESPCTFLSFPFTCNFFCGHIWSKWGSIKKWCCSVHVVSVVDMRSAVWAREQFHSSTTAEYRPQRTHADMFCMPSCNIDWISKCTNYPSRRRVCKVFKTWFPAPLCKDIAVTDTVCPDLGERQHLPPH